MTSLSSSCDPSRAVRGCSVLSQEPYAGVRQLGVSLWGRVGSMVYTARHQYGCNVRDKSLGFETQLHVSQLLPSSLAGGACCCQLCFVKLSYLAAAPQCLLCWARGLCRRGEEGLEQSNVRKDASVMRK